MIRRRVGCYNPAQLMVDSGSVGIERYQGMLVGMSIPDGALITYCDGNVILFSLFLGPKVARPVTSSYESDTARLSAGGDGAPS